ncbi:DUF3304 domain-containing protein [Pseudoxanthomonas mexicana]|uniref:DUF3304 domain-containing protein n=1 Tax=Pseudoxanthomonas mexicana TaxID=128785 RepID=UPI00398A6039
MKKKYPGCWLWLTLTFLPLAGCAQDPEPGLGIHSYNYMDRTISSFSVDGNWGGNVFTSTPTSGGGKAICCMRMPFASELPKTYTVRWIAQMCREQVYGGGEWFTNYRSDWREKQVQYAGPLPANPLYFEVHFYSNDDIRIEITDDYTPPRLILPVDERDQRPGIPDWPECTEEQKRTFAK